MAGSRRGAAARWALALLLLLCRHSSSVAGQTGNTCSCGSLSPTTNSSWARIQGFFNSKRFIELASLSTQTTPQNVTIRVVVHVIEPEEGSTAWSSRHYDEVNDPMVEITIDYLNEVFETLQRDSNMTTAFSFKLARVAAPSRPGASSSSRAFLPVTDTSWFDAPVRARQLRDPATVEDVRRAKHRVGSAATLNVYVRSLRASGVYGAATFPHWLAQPRSMLPYPAPPFYQYSVKHDGITIDGSTLIGSQHRGILIQDLPPKMTLAHHVVEWLGLAHKQSDDVDACAGLQRTDEMQSRLPQAWAVLRQAGAFAAPVIPELRRVILTSASMQLPVFDAVAAPACGSKLLLLFHQERAPARGTLLTTVTHDSNSTANSTATVVTYTYTPNEGQGADGLADEFTYFITDPCAGSSNVGSLQVLFPTLEAVADDWVKPAGDRHELDVLHNDVADGVEGVTIIDVTQPTGAGGETGVEPGARTVWFQAPVTTGTSTFSYTISGTSNVTGAVLTSTASVTVTLVPVCQSLRNLGCLTAEAEQLTGNICPSGKHCMASSSKPGILCAYALRPAGFVCRQARACGPCGGISLSCDGAKPACPPFPAAQSIAKIVVKQTPGAKEAYMCSHDSSNSNWGAPPLLNSPTGAALAKDWIIHELPAQRQLGGRTWEYYVRGCDADSAASGCDTSKAHQQCRVAAKFVYRASQAQHCSAEGAERVVELACVYREADQTCWWSCKQ